MRTSRALLELKDVHASHGMVEALKGIDLHVDEGEIVTLLGNNGAGKSTVLGVISGIVKPRRGEIWFRGQDVTGCRPEEVVRRGIAQAPEGRRIFEPLTVEENLLVGAFSVRAQREQVKEDMRRIYEMFPQLLALRSQLAGTLSGGEQQMLALGRALMARPVLLLLDESSMGLSPNLRRFIFRTVRQINEAGTTVLMVEQNARAALRLASRAYVLEAGRVALHGSADELSKNPAVISAYLGGGG
ncbi:ABC transporter ATP-binding protein [Sorangium cellulosum]|uniref:ABC transporter ATP-binding protein n=1 Tax=Sorangium cellulosum TaxID=56 RepID=A0A150R6H2_SORCE|nr:ABC transporter ATP-binding protein [Sorangium cellulosum]